jgi:hypothetical protein
MSESGTVALHERSLAPLVQTRSFGMTQLKRKRI